MPTNKINMAELLADRHEVRANVHSSLVLARRAVERVIEHCRGADFSCDMKAATKAVLSDPRIARLPDLEAAFIEAVKALEIMAKDNYPSALTMNEMARITLEKIRG